ncbi:MAG: UvrD-helicase domain-containing protein [Oscillospiraceae bacterium]|nr:UvrD-helicase domain-containing protein [Oscillospiraceae bacterium]
MTAEEFRELRREALRRFFSRMNPPQLEAVTTVKGAVLVLAGAGSGKTTCIVNRIANMVLFGDSAQADMPVPDAGTIRRLQEYVSGAPMETEELQEIIAHRPVRPWQILAITFTNKAAGELKSRLADTLGEAAQDIHAATFHSACVRMLRSCIDRLGYDNSFTIYDSDDSLRTMKAVMKDLDIPEKKFPPKSILSAISSAKDRMISPEEYAAQAGHDYWKTIAARLYTAYQKRLYDANALDFDDLIYMTVRVLRECPDVLEKFQNRYRFILVDEYQDTNFSQYCLVSLLAQEHGNLCVVGDDDQSIYRFRGATIENILNFEEQFTGCKVVRLEQNYRSTQHILNAANGVIANNEGRKEKALWTAAGDGSKVSLVKVPGERDEGQFICDTIEKGIAAGKQYSDFAVLYRMNALSNSVERAMLRNKIDYRIFGGVRFLDRKEIKDVVAYLAVIHNPNDFVRFERIVNVPKRGIGEATAANVIQIAQDLGMTPLEVARDCDQFPIIAKRSGANLKAFAAMMEEFAEMAEELPLEELFYQVTERSGYLAMLRDEGEEGEERLENVREFRSNIVTYQTETPEPTLAGFLDETSLYTDAGAQTNENVVSLMTMHAAKGLEFDTVFAVGMETGIFPSSRSFDAPEDMEEERRLAYVTITRAKRELYLLSAQSRLLFGSTKFNPVSRFVKEIPEADLDIDDRTVTQTAGSAPTVSRLGGMRRQMNAIRQTAGAAAKASGQTLTFADGDRIADQVFGEGTILRAEPMAGDWLLEVMFDTVGTKKLMAKYRKLRKL